MCCNSTVDLCNLHTYVSQSLVFLLYFNFELIQLYLSVPRVDNVTLHIDGILYLKVFDSYKVCSNTISVVAVQCSSQFDQVTCL